jgi:hypothetical protein
MTVFELLTTVNTHSSAYHSGQIVGQILKIAVVVVVIVALAKWASKRRNARRP